MHTFKKQLTLMHQWQLISIQVDNLYGNEKNFVQQWMARKLIQHHGFEPQFINIQTLADSPAESIETRLWGIDEKYLFNSTFDTKERAFEYLSSKNNHECYEMDKGAGLSAEEESEEEQRIQLFSAAKPEVMEAFEAALMLSESPTKELPACLALSMRCKTEVCNEDPPGGLFFYPDGPLPFSQHYGCSDIYFSIRKIKDFGGGYNTLKILKEHYERVIHYIHSGDEEATHPAFMRENGKGELSSKIEALMNIVEKKGSHTTSFYIKGDYEDFKTNEDHSRRGFIHVDLNSSEKREILLDFMQSYRRFYAAMATVSVHESDMTQNFEIHPLNLVLQNPLVFNKFHIPATTNQPHLAFLQSYLNSILIYPSLQKSITPASSSGPNHSKTMNNNRF